MEDLNLEVEDDFITIKPSFQDLSFAVCKNTIQSFSAAQRGRQRGTDSNRGQVSDRLSGVTGRALA